MMSDTVIITLHLIIIVLFFLPVDIIKLYVYPSNDLFSPLDISNKADHSLSFRQQ